MLHVTIKKTAYQIATDWSDITIKQAIRLLEVEPPERLVKLITTGVDESTTADLMKGYPDYFGRVLSVLSDIPPEVIDHLHSGDRTGLYASHLRHLLPELMAMAPAYVQTRESFDFLGTTFYLPTSAKVFGKELPFYSQDALTFTEMADLMLAVQSITTDGLKSAPMLVAVTCRQEGRPYNEAEAVQWAERFGDLPMNIFWSVFFSFNETLKSSLTSSLQHLEGLIVEHRGRLERLTRGTLSERISLSWHGSALRVKFKRLKNCLSILFMKLLRRSDDGTVDD